jgi:putative salt-induced outer membrane protein YdiY
MKKVFVWLLCLLILAGNVAGQEGEEGGSKWTSSVGLGLTATSGNSDITNLALTFQAVNEMERAKWSTNANVTYATTDGDETANKGGIFTQFDYFQTERFFYYGKAGFEFDKFAELDLRTSPGAGVGYVLAQREGIELTASAGANVVTDFFSDDTEDTRATTSFAEEFKYAFSSTADLFQSFNIQNNFEDFGDYLISAEVSLTSKMSDRLSLKASLLDRYDSDPFSEDLKNNDLTFITSLNYTL